LAPRGVPQIEVSFEVDVNGILTVEAHDKGSGNKQSIKIKNEKGRLSQEQIDKMLKEAEKFKEEDRKRKSVIEARDGLERYIYSLKDQVNDKKSLGGKLSDSEKETIEKSLSESEAWLNENREKASRDDYEAEKKKLEDIVTPIVSKLYGEAGAPPGGEQEGEQEGAAEKEEL